MAQDLIVFSHLRWRGDPQRPHRVMRLLANHRRVFFFEEPVLRESLEPSLDIEEVQPNLYVCQPQTPEKVTGFHERQLPYLDHLLADLLEQYRIDDWIAWFYTPVAEPMVHDYEPAAIVYDCMAEVHVSLHRKQPLLQSELDLLQIADLVFTNTPGLHQAMRQQHQAVHCLFDGVEVEHFARAAGTLPEAPIQAGLPHPRVGFHGAIDQRFDMALLAAVARAHPDWQFVVVGPILRLDQEMVLPQLQNIRYFGRERYEDLPNFMCGWDLCILPFVRDDTTAMLSPSKLLECMAAERPIVTTTVQGFRDWFDREVYWAESESQFIAACEQALSESAEERRERERAMHATLARTAWQRTAEQMQQLLEDAVAKNRKRRHAARRPHVLPHPDMGAAEPALRETGSRPAGPPPVVIIGAGPAGLSAAYHLGPQALLLEQHDQIGGNCRSIEEHGFTFDYGGHVLGSKDPWVQQMVQRLLGDNLHWQLAEAWIYSANSYNRYPFEESLYGLPADVIQECVMGALNRQRPAETPVQRLVDEGSLESTQPLNTQTIPFPNRRKGPRNLEDFVYEVWGGGIAKHFLLPYNEKFWTVPLRELEVEALRGASIDFDLGRIIAGALKPTPQDSERDSYFGYPLRGGYQALVDGFLPLLQSEVRLNACVAAIEPGARRLHLSDGSTVSYQRLISTMPLPRLIELCEAEAPEEVRVAARALRHTSIRCVHLGIGREHLTDRHWIYFPEEPLFHRVFAQGNASPYCNAPGGFGLSCEIAYSAAKPLAKTGEALIQQCILECIKVGLVRSHDPIWTAHELDIPYAYPIPDHAHHRHLETIQDWLDLQGIVTAGMHGEWRNYGADHAMISGRDAAQRLLTKLSGFPFAGHA